MIRNQMKMVKSKIKTKPRIRNETYGDLVERDLRLEVGVVSGRRKCAFHCELMCPNTPISHHHIRFDRSLLNSLKSLHYALFILAVVSKIFTIIWGIDGKTEQSDHVDGPWGQPAGNGNGQWRSDSNCSSALYYAHDCVMHQSGAL